MNIVSMTSCVRRLSGAPGRNRTHDLLVRSQALYPTELQGHGQRIAQLAVRGAILTGMNTDDDDLDAPSSSTDYFSHADRGRLRRVERVLGKKVDPSTMSKLGGLKGRVNLARQQEDAAAMTKAHTSADDTKEAQGTTGGTKTREQEIRADTQHIGSKPSAEQSVKTGKRAEKIKEDRLKAGESQRQAA